MMRVLVPLLFAMVILYWICQLLWFVFVVHFVDVLVVLFIFCVFFGLFRWFWRAFS